MRSKRESGAVGADVVVVGRGPVGQLTAALLARRGHVVVLLEKHATSYRLPRAVHLTGEVLRGVDPIGAAHGYQRFGIPITAGAEFLDADHEVLLQLPHTSVTPQGWPDDLAVNQPAFEDVLQERAASYPTLTVLTEAEVIAVGGSNDTVVADYRTAGGAVHRVTARYLVACDGANSSLREMRKIPVTDTGFSADWFVVDVRSELPFGRKADVTQVCDPRRPTTCVASGPGRRRFEFMRVGDESLDILATLDSAWSLLAPWGYTRDNATIEKKEMYTFRARWAEQWVDDRVILAGDAAHQMPPMGGAGLVSGIRDAANLAWKLDLVLRGVAAPALLATYATERSAHVQHAIWTSIEFGKLVCETDEEAASARNLALRANGVRAFPAPPPERLGPGALASPELADQTSVGTLGVQGRLELADGTRELADRLADGFAVLLDGARVDTQSALRLARRIPEDIAASVLLLVDHHSVAGRQDIPGLRSVVDVDGVYRRRFDATGAVVEVMRPDFYVYGTAADLDGGLRLVDSLRASLHLREPSLLPR